MTCIRPAATSRPTRKAGVGGFTLIEIMIVVLIIGILMAIAYPAYQNNVIRSRRATAGGCLLEAAQFMERYYTTRLTYVGAALPACSADLSRFYAFSFDGAVAARSFKIQAVPRGVQLKDTQCATIKINQTGQKEETGTAASPRDCF